MFSKSRTHVLILLFLMASAPSRAQDSNVQEGDIKLVSYLVRKSDLVATIAMRFHTSEKELTKVNKIKGKNSRVLPGRILQIPVKVRPKVWNPMANTSFSAANLPNEDRRPSEDYEVITEGFDDAMKDDFIGLTEARDDSTHYEKIGEHIAKIDSRIKYLYYRIDSFKKVDFAFNYDEKDVNSVLAKMKLARDKFYLQGPIGKNIDSLNEVKKILSEYRTKIRTKLSEYEYLIENASYFQKNYDKEQEEEHRIRWSNQLAKESDYKKTQSEQRPATVVSAVLTEMPEPAIVKVSAPVAKIVDTPKLTVAQAIKAELQIDTIPVDDKPIEMIKVPVVQTPKYDTSRGVKWVDITKAIGFKKIQVDTTTPLKISQGLDSPEAVLDTFTTLVPHGDVRLEQIDFSLVKIRETTSQLRSLALFLRDIDTTRSSEMISYHYTPLVRDTELTAARISKPLLKHAPAPTILTNKVISKGVPKLEALKKETIHKNPIPVSVKQDTVAKKPLPVVVPRPIAVKKDTLVKKPSYEVKSKLIAQNKDTVLKKPSLVLTSKSEAAKRDTIANKRLPVMVAKSIEVKKDTIISKSISIVAPKPIVLKKEVIIKKPIPVLVPKLVPEKKDNAVNKPLQVAVPKAVVTKKDNSVNKPLPVLPSKVKDTIGKQKIPSQNPISLKMDTHQTPTSRAKIDFAVMSSITLKALNVELFSQTLDTRFDTIVVTKEKITSNDPLQKYKSDSGFVFPTIELKDVPITSYKNRPKYLIPVDSISKIKGEFFLLRARQSLEKGDFKTGEKYLQKSLDLNPNCAEAWMLHADLFLTIGAANKALKEYVISSEIDSSNPKIFYNIAILYSKANDDQQAYKYFSKATEVNSKYLLAYIGRASLQMDQRDFEGAIEDYNKALDINKYYTPAYKARGVAKMEMQRFADAVLDFNAYLDIEDPDGYVIYQRGIAKILSNNLLQGCLDLASALELGFKDAEKAIKKYCE